MLAGLLEVASGHKAQVELALGRSLVVLTPDWPASSPQARGISANSRALFASVSNAQLRCTLPRL